MTLAKQLAELESLTTGQLRQTYADLFGDECRSGNRTWLIRRIAWRLQANALGGLSQRALERAKELANESDLRLMPPRTPRTDAERPAPVSTKRLPKTGDQRLPVPGTLLTRRYKGREIRVQVLEHGFEYLGERYSSLSAVAKAITGSHWNGMKFFNLNAEGAND